jgi:predicted PurR-regulated permease PerM
MSFANNFVGGIGDVLAEALLILTIVLFMLVEASGYPRKLAAMADQRGGSKLQRIADVIQGINRYASVKALVSLATGLLIWLGLEWVGLDFAPLWGPVAFLLNFIPNIRSLLAAIPAVSLALLQLDLTAVLMVIGIYWLVNSLVGGVIEPMVMGQSVDLSVLTVFLSLLLWGWMFGAVGMLLSVPLTMILKYAADSGPQTRWLAILLSPAPVAENIRE